MCKKNMDAELYEKGDREILLDVILMRDGAGAYSEETCQCAKIERLEAALLNERHERVKLERELSELKADWSNTIKLFEKILEEEKARAKLEKPERWAEVEYDITTRKIR